MSNDLVGGAGAPHHAPIPAAARLSLRSRLLLLMLVAVAPWVIAMSTHLWHGQQRAISAATDDALDLARAAAARQEQAIANARAMLQVLSTLPAVRTGSADDCRRQLSEIHRQATDYANFVVTDAAGHMLCASKGSGATSFSEREWYRQAVAQRGFVTTPMIFGKLQGLAVLPTAQPILNPYGEVERVVLAAVNVEWLGRLLRQTRLSKDGALSVVDGSAATLAREPADATLIGKPLALPAVVDLVHAGRQAEASGQARDVQGQAMLYAVARVPGAAPVYVVASLPVAGVLAQAQHEFRTNLGILGALTVFMLALTWFLIEAFALRDVRSLIALARRVASGDYHARAALDSARGEVGELARAFNDMAVSIDQHFEQATRIMEVVPEAIIMSNTEGRIVRVNKQAETIFGYDASELTGQLIEVLIPERFHAHHAGHRHMYMNEPVSRQMGTRGNLFGRRKDGSEFPVDISLALLKGEQGGLVISAVRDISERQTYEAKIVHQAMHDALTDLPNRAMFRELLARAMTQADRAEKLLAVMFLDLDGFKNVNDTLGHEAGDALLKVISHRLVGALRREDVVARQGGDEFTLLLPGLNIFQDIVQIAEKLLAAVAEPVLYQGHAIHITASIGVTIFPFDDLDAESLLRNADTAMYEAKQAGKNNFRFYTADMNAAMRERMDIEAGLREALEKHQFTLYYQPQAAIDNLQVVGVEALLRWTHPDLGPVSPAKFIPVAEESGLIVPIGEWVLREACRQIRVWREAGWSNLKVAVNLSARQFRQDDLLDTVHRILREAGLTPEDGALELELTESMVMQRVDAHVQTLKKLHAMGVSLSIDDFGTGYSSLSYLKRFPIQTLKIDQSFVRDLTVDAEDAAIASAIITLGHSLKLKVIAEGVETIEQLAALRALGCDEIQGYYFGKPMPADAMTTFLSASCNV